jgi:hypothetical protein
MLSTVPRKTPSILYTSEDKKSTHLFSKTGPRSLELDLFTAIPEKSSLKLGIENRVPY